MVLLTAMTNDLQTGGSPIISYSLEWDKGTSGNSYEPIVGYLDNNMNLTYVID